MHHCLGTLADQRVRAQRGRFFAFALQWPWRLTLALACDAHGRWRIYDLAGVANARAPAQAWAWAEAFVERWNRSTRAAPLAPEQLALFGDDGQLLAHDMA